MQHAGVRVGKEFGHSINLSIVFVHLCANKTMPSKTKINSRHGGQLHIVIQLQLVTIYPSNFTLIVIEVSVGLIATLQLQLRSCNYCHVQLLRRTAFGYIRAFDKTVNRLWFDI